MKDENAMTRLIMLPSSRHYAANSESDPLRFYYFPFFGALYRARVEKCLSLLPGGKRILEVGFGSGVTFLNLAQLYSEINGIDFNADSAAVTECFSKRGVIAKLVNGSITSAPYPDDHFDAVLCISVLEHLKQDELDAACREIRRVLCPAGVLVYGVPVDRPLMTASFRLLGYNIHEHHFSTEKDVFAAAKRYLTPDRTEVIYGLGGLAGPIYETGRLLKK